MLTVGIASVLSLPWDFSICLQFRNITPTDRQFPLSYYAAYETSALSHHDAAYYSFRMPLMQYYKPRAISSRHDAGHISRYHMLLRLIGISGWKMPFTMAINTLLLRQCPLLMIR